MTHKCEVCGSPVKIVGHTTKHYEPIDEITELKAKLAIAKEALEKIDLIDGDCGHAYSECRCIFKIGEITSEALGKLVDG